MAGTRLQARSSATDCGFWKRSSSGVLDGLRGEIEKGRRSGRPKPAAEVLDRLERKYAKMTKDSGK